MLALRENTPPNGSMGPFLARLERFRAFWSFIGLHGPGPRGLVWALKGLWAVFSGVWGLVQCSLLGVEVVLVDPK